MIKQVALLFLLGSALVNCGKSKKNKTPKTVEVDLDEGVDIDSKDIMSFGGECPDSNTLIKRARNSKLGFSDFIKTKALNSKNLDCAPNLKNSNIIRFSLEFNGKECRFFVILGDSSSKSSSKKNKEKSLDIKVDVGKTIKFNSDYLSCDVEEKEEELTNDSDEEINEQIHESEEIVESQNTQEDALPESDSKDETSNVDNSSVVSNQDVSDIEEIPTKVVEKKPFLKRGEGKLAKTAIPESTPAVESEQVKEESNKIFSNFLKKGEGKLAKTAVPQDASDESTETVSKKAEPVKKEFLKKKSGLEKYQSKGNSVLKANAEPRTKFTPSAFVGAAHPCSEEQKEKVSEIFSYLASKKMIKNVEVNATNVIDCTAQITNGVNYKMNISLFNENCFIKFHHSSSNTLELMYPSNCTEHFALKTDVIPQPKKVHRFWTPVYNQASQIPRVFAYMINKGIIAPIVMYRENVKSVVKQTGVETKYRAKISFNENICILFYSVDSYNETSLLDDTYKDNKYSNCKAVYAQ